MAKAKEAMPRRARERRAAAGLRAPKDRELILQILKEMHHLILDAAQDIGVSPKDAKRALKLAAEDPKRRRISERTMDVNFRIAALLNRWRNDKRYQQPDGTPKALSVRGNGATFQTLARLFVPQLKLNELADLVCENAEVMRLKGRKLALIGSPVMMTPKTPETTLASLAVRLRRVSQTILHNASLPAKGNSTGRFERIVTGELNDREFREFAQQIRQPMQDLCDRVDAGIRQPTLARRGRRKGKACGIGLYVFQDDGDTG